MKFDYIYCNMNVMRGRRASRGAAWREAVCFRRKIICARFARCEKLLRIKRVAPVGAPAARGYGMVRRTAAVVEAPARAHVLLALNLLSLPSAR